MSRSLHFVTASRGIRVEMSHEELDELNRRHLAGDTKGVIEHIVRRAAKYEQPHAPLSRLEPGHVGLGENWSTRTDGLRGTVDPHFYAGSLHVSESDKWGPPWASVPLVIKGSLRPEHVRPGFDGDKGDHLIAKAHSPVLVRRASIVLPGKAGLGPSTPNVASHPDFGSHRPAVSPETLSAQFSGFTSHA
jgi:hypothetical protein